MAVSVWLRRIVRFRVSVGFVLASIAFWFARPSWLSLGAGTVVACVGELLRVWAAGHLEKGSEVTISGPYRWMKHPLYVGSSLLGIGFAVASRHTVVAVIIMVYLTVSLLVAARLEEANLRVKFGDAYDRYVAGTVDDSDRACLLARVRRNGEVKTVMGILAALGILVFKIIGVH